MNRCPDPLKQWVSEPKAMFSRENITHSKVSQKLSSRLFPRKGIPFVSTEGVWWPSTVIWLQCQPPLPVHPWMVPFLSGCRGVQCYLVICSLWTPNKKKVKDHQTTQNQKPNLNTKVSTPSPISFLPNLGFLLQGLQCCADGGAVWSTSSGATGDMQRSRLRILREPGEMEM